MKKGCVNKQVRFLLFEEMEHKMISDPKYVIPMGLRSSGRGERAYVFYSLLLKERIVFLGTQIDDQVANVSWHNCYF